jgi:hypothetical protein
MLVVAVKLVSDRTVVVTRVCQSEIELASAA